MNKVLTGLMITASLVPAFAQEKQDDKTWEQRYNEAIEKQMKERTAAFSGPEKISSSDIEKLIEKHRNIIIQLEKERVNQR